MHDPKHNMTKREIDPYIRGGSPQSMKTAVALFMKMSGDEAVLRCSGTILSKDKVLTAAHCVETLVNSVNNITVVAGEGDLRSYMTGNPNIAVESKVTQINIHPLYEHVPGDKLIWDLAIISLRTKLPLDTNPRIQAALLPPPGMVHKEKEVRVGGWGLKDEYSGISVVHNAIDIKIISDDECFDSYGEGDYMPGQMFCGGDRGRTTCRGDSGSGAIFRGWKKPIIQGTLSFGTKAGKSLVGFSN